MSLEAVHLCVDWARNNGAFIDERIDFKLDTATGLHAISKAPIKDGKELIKIPEKLLLYREVAEAHFKVETPAGTNPNALLQLYVAKLKFDSACKDSTFFQPYLNTLPTPTSINAPYFWTSNELLALKGTDLLIKTERNLKKLVSEWFAIVTHLNVMDDDDTQFYLQSSSTRISDLILRSDNLKWHSFHAYLWATYIFSSRAFPELLLKRKVEDVNQAFLFPIVDLLNHANLTKVAWGLADGSGDATFSTKETLKAGDELLNNYGNKSNEELILGYGFSLPNNDFDTATLTLRLPAGQLQSFETQGLELEDINLAENSVNFTLSMATPLPPQLIHLFGILNQLSSEQVCTTRSILEGTTQLNKVIDQKIAFYKSASKLKASLANSERSKLTKTYMTGTKRIYQECCDSIKRFQKRLLKELKPMSFKSLFKSDTTFANSLTLTFAITKYEDLLTKGFLQQALLLFIVRLSNEGPNMQVPKFIQDCFKDVAETIVVDKEDVQEYLPFYKSLFPQLSSKIPEIYNQGDWGIKSFIIAGTVLDRLMWQSPLSHEVYFLERMPYSFAKAGPEIHDRIASLRV
ncbi:LADA_0F00518g1_1 [Lachancea dasiensis]|uniref:LADA_0F00518g1_1 n=1 Tax=Lachancea dasiensis TaxID=1072105 RepID=A0A1G4JHV0_9SACH|nr:LADA_0F00518g1_1 [Lachancea dasiensis]